MRKKSNNFKEDLNEFVKKENEDYNCNLLLVCIFQLIMIPVSYILYGNLVSYYWEWFAIPLSNHIFNYSLQSISWPIGIAIVCFSFSLQKIRVPLQEVALQAIIFRPFLYYIYFMLLGYAFQTFIF